MKAKDKIRASLAECEEWIRQGQIQKARVLLSSMNLAELPRELRLPVANLCRRVRLTSTGLKALWPITGPDREIAVDPPTAAELAEFAFLLSRYGSVREAVSIFEGINRDICPESLLYQAMSHIDVWEPNEARECLQDYLRRPVGEYSRLIAYVNLASALISTENYDHALEVLDRALVDMGERGYNRLAGNCHELRAHAQIMLGRYAPAEQELETAARLLGAGSPWDYFFVRKWSAVLKSLRDRDGADLRVIREEAVERLEAENVREADLFLLKNEFEPKAFAHLLIGTPFPFYRERIRATLGSEHVVGDLIWGKEGAPILDISTGEIDGTKIFNPGKKIHQVIEVLTRDLYLPMRIGALFAALFPDEGFDIHSSPARVHNILMRTRTFLKENDVPLEILETKGLYSLRVSGSIALRLQLERGRVDGMNAHFEKLKVHFQDAERFASREALALLGLKPTTFKAFMKWAVNEGHLEPLGAAKSGLYRLRRQAQAA